MNVHGRLTMAKKIEYISVNASVKRKYVPETEDDTEECFFQQQLRDNLYSARNVQTIDGEVKVNILIYFK